METLLSCLTAKIKQRGMTINEFCQKTGISRQKFYRFVKEPARFPNQTVQAAVKVLSLDKSETEQLESHLGLRQQTGSGVQRSKDSIYDLSFYNDIMKRLLTHDLSAELVPDLDMIEYMQSDCHLSLESPASLARLIAGIQEGAQAASHDFTFTIYNCVPSIADDPDRSPLRPVRSIQVIASLMKELEDLLIPSSSVRIRIKHYLSDLQYARMKSAGPGDPSAALFHLHVLDTILPLLSMAEDYSIDLSGSLKNTGAEYVNACLIRHLISVPAQEPYVEYYLFLFSLGNTCRACRLGSREVSHIFRFLSDDIRGTEKSAEKRKTTDPNLFYYQLEQKYRSVLIHPDLCFDDIPKQVWMSLYNSVQESEDRSLYIAAFRKLMDPFDMYTFLDFEDLVESMIDTIEKRNKAASRLGKSVICHPDGLLNMVRTGMISDLSNETLNFKGQSRDPDDLRFSAPIIRILLEIIRSSILKRMESDITDPSGYDWINYYILQPEYPCPDVSFVIYDDLGVGPFYTKGRHKNSSTNIYESPEAGTVLYDYIVKEVIGKRGEKLRSAIMSDEHSVALIDSLISMLEE